MSSILALRTNEFGPATREGLERLCSVGMDVIVAADERNGAFDTWPFRKASLTDETIGQLGLRAHRDMGWLCGDYFAYLVAREAPEVDYFWITEPDIRYNFADPSEFFAAFEGADTDLIAVRYDRETADWYWNDRMTPYAPNVHRMLFGGVRLSRSAVSAAFELRQRLPADIADYRYPNDEAVVATAVAAAGLSGKTYADFGRFTTTASFSFAKPISGLLFDTMPADGLVYHPILYGESYRRKAHAFCRRYPTASNIAQMRDGVARELGADAASQFFREAQRYLPAEGGTR